MGISWSHIRVVAGWMAISVVSATVFGPIGQFFISLADERGWYQHPGAKMSAVIAWLSTLTGNAWFHWIGGGIVGFAIGAWVDGWVRRGSGTLSLAITDLIITDLVGQPGRVDILLGVNAEATGNPISIKDWTLQISVPGHPEQNIKPSPISERRTWDLGPPKGVHAVTPETALWSSIGAPEIRGFRSGWIWFPLHWVSVPSLGDDKTRLVLSARDRDSHTHLFATTLGELRTLYPTSLPAVPPPFPKRPE
jgi:hypothetical protein